MFEVKILKDGIQTHGAKFHSELEANEWISSIESQVPCPWGEGYSVEIGEEVKSQEEKNAEFKKYLADTDWYVVRHVETGIAVPQDILNARALARQSIVE